jgi:hypothetical protein
MIAFPACRRRRVEADFGGGDISSNGGVGLLDLAERRVGLLSSLARRLDDGRQAGKIRHELLPLLRQRVFSVALGYEDANDHDALRDDLALQTACGRDRRLASASTIGRLDRAADRSWAWAAHEAMVESFIASFDTPPAELILDFDATDDAVHGRQEGRFFHGYYDHHCFLPLYVFCGDQLLVSYLRPSNIDGAKHAWAILALLVKRLRQVWPEVRIILRADSGFCRHKMLSWCERRDVGYIIGLYCQRGEMENRIKEQQLDLFADRTSCHKWRPNQFRLILASLAYNLIEAIRRLALAGTEMARAQAGTIRLKLLKIGAVITRNTRRVAIHLSTACPEKALFTLAVARLKPG